MLSAIPEGMSSYPRARFDKQVLMFLTFATVMWWFVFVLIAG